MKPVYKPEAHPYLTEFTGELKLVGGKKREGWERGPVPEWAARAAEVSAPLPADRWVMKRRVKTEVEIAVAVRDGAGYHTIMDACR